MENKSVSGACLRLVESLLSEGAGASDCLPVAGVVEDVLKGCGFPFPLASSVPVLDVCRWLVETLGTGWDKDIWEAMIPVVLANGQVGCSNCGAYASGSGAVPVAWVERDPDWDGERLYLCVSCAEADGSLP